MLNQVYPPTSHLVNSLKSKTLVNLMFTRVFNFYAEEEGFEPPVPHGTTVFKTAAIDHSATPLNRVERSSSVQK